LLDALPTPNEHAVLIWERAGIRIDECHFADARFSCNKDDLPLPFERSTAVPLELFELMSAFKHSVRSLYGRRCVVLRCSRPSHFAKKSGLSNPTQAFS
jgi:hypothetical protein